MIGGKTEANDWTFDYGLARSHNEVVEPNQLWQFRGNPGTVDFDFTDKLFSAVPRTPLSPSNLGFRQYTVQDESGDEYIWTGRDRKSGVEGKRVSVRVDLGGGRRLKKQT